jgi:hypothetical protein
MVVLKRPASQISIRKRDMQLFSQEKLYAAQLRTHALLNLVRYRMTGNVMYQNTARIMLVRRLGIMYVSDGEWRIPRPLRWHNSFDSFTNGQCYKFFSFKKEHLPRLFIALRIPDEVHLENRCVFSGEEVLMRGMYELVSGEDQDSTAMNVFGRDQSQQSRVAKWFINHMYDHFADLVLNNLAWWVNSGFFEQSRAAIERKMNDHGLIYQLGAFLIGALIDCNCLETSTPGGGPVTPGVNADRWDPLIQEAFYNGWKSIHGLKHQTLDNAFGFTMDLYGPWSLRRNDLRLLGQSQLNFRLSRLGLLTGYEDSIYPHMSNITSCHKGEVLTQRERRENKVFKKIRIAVEWNYMITSNLFGYLRNFEKLKLLSSDYVSKVYTVCTILRNCHVAMYGCITSDYFGLVMPPNMLERLMQVRP